ncbi:MAG: FtsX-like permease family protein [Flavobacteriales bacterium]|nr:FtsX-like permease family protein [Flavobacteriales bacterium]
MIFLKLFSESIKMAWNALVSNKLRTILSLLGITIGIMAIILVFTFVDSMEKNIRDNVQSLGDNTVYIQKWPWATGTDFEWWKYWQRPDADLNDFKEVQRRSDAAESVVFMASKNKSVEHESTVVENVSVVAVTHDYDKIKSFDIVSGRYLTLMESNTGKNVCIIGMAVAQGLFGDRNPVGETVKVFKRKLTVIGVFGVEGESVFGNSVDNQLLMPINFARQVMRIESRGSNPLVMVKGKPGVSTAELKDELRGIMRSVRRLKPRADDNFALNEISVLSNSLESLFTILNIAGTIIGGFSILVGGFGIANIMFVSVKERTHLIGIEKSLGAKNWFIMMEFLSEAVFLCLMGGGVGLFMAGLLSGIASYAFDVTMYLTMKNMMLGITISVTIGLVAGIIPAFLASRLSPVEAIRSK